MKAAVSQLEARPGLFLLLLIAGLTVAATGLAAMRSVPLKMLLR
ncbi:MAG: hypothetical protein U0790_05340 [Isosphaeraceae bacterium]